MQNRIVENITIERDGKQYTLNNLEMQLAFDAQNLIYRMEDAAYHLGTYMSNLVEHDDTRWSTWLIPSQYIDSGECDKLLHDIAAYFIDSQDNQMADSDTWNMVTETIIPKHLVKRMLMYIASRFNSEIKPDKARIDDLGQVITNITLDPKAADKFIKDSDIMNASVSAPRKLIAEKLINTVCPKNSAIAWPDVETCLEFCKCNLDEPDANSVLPHSDEKFAEKKAYEISNACWDAFNATVDPAHNYRAGATPSNDVIKNALETLLADTTDEISDKCIADTHKAMNTIAMKHDLTPGYYPYDKDLISEVILAVNQVLIKHKINVCLPFEDGMDYAAKKPCVCYSTNQRCAYCPYNIKGNKKFV